MGDCLPQLQEGIKVLTQYNLIDTALVDDTAIHDELQLVDVRDRRRERDNLGGHFLIRHSNRVAAWDLAPSFLSGRKRGCKTGTRR